VEKKQTLKALIRAAKKPKTPYEALTQIEGLLKDERRWIKGDEAIDLNDEGMDVEDAPSSKLKKVTKLCMIGAVYFVDGPSEDEVKIALAIAVWQLFADRSDVPTYEETRLDYLTGWLEHPSSFDNPEFITSFNDHGDTTHADVLKVIDYSRLVLTQLANLREAKNSVKTLTEEIIETVKPKPAKVAKKPAKVAKKPAKKNPVAKKKANK